MRMQGESWILWILQVGGGDFKIQRIHKNQAEFRGGEFFEFWGADFKIQRIHKIQTELNRAWIL